MCHVRTQVWLAVKLLEVLGQHKTARRLKYGEWCLRGDEQGLLTRVDSQPVSQPVSRTPFGLTHRLSCLCVPPCHCWLGHMCWAIQNSAKTDRNLFFGSRNLKALAAQLSEADQGEGT